MLFTVHCKRCKLYNIKVLNMYTRHVVHCILCTLYTVLCTLYPICALCRQKREKALREKKDVMINKMAAEQKKKMAEGRKVNQYKGIVDVISKVGFLIHSGTCKPFSD